MTGQLALPGGGTATQALQKQEIESLIAAGGGGGGGGGGGDATPGVRYQKGTWTPAFCFSDGTIGTSVTTSVSDTPATWVRVGNQVTISGWAALTDIGSLTGNCCLGGAPYPSDNGYYSGSISYWTLGEAVVDTGLTITGGFPDAVNPSVMLFRQITTANAIMQQPVYGGGIVNGSNVIFTITYFTDNTDFSPATGSEVTEDTQGIGGGGATGLRYQQGLSLIHI